MALDKGKLIIPNSKGYYTPSPQTMWQLTRMVAMLAAVVPKSAPHQQREERQRRVRRLPMTRCINEFNRHYINATSLRCLRANQGQLLSYQQGACWNIFSMKCAAAELIYSLNPSSYAAKVVGRMRSTTFSAS